MVMLMVKFKINKITDKLRDFGSTGSMDYITFLNKNEVTSFQPEIKILYKLSSEPED